MGKTLTLAKRELLGYFVSPIAYIIGALFLLASAALFFSSMEVGGEASLRPLFHIMALLMVAAVPLLTMGLLSKEFDSGTIETLMTSPVTETQVVLGKFLGVFAFYLLLLASTLLLMGLMVAFGRPDVGVAAMGYVGMALLGAAYISVGLFASAMTRHQLVAVVIGIVIVGFLAILTGVVVRLAVAPWDVLADHVNAMRWFTYFSRGVFDTRGLVYFLSTTAMFLFLSVKVLESRRWR